MTEFRSKQKRKLTSFARKYRRSLVIHLRIRENSMAKRADRVAAKGKALGAMHPRAAARAVGKAKAEGRTYPTSGQRARAAKNTKKGK